jgi:hypothetical protein
VPDAAVLDPPPTAAAATGPLADLILCRLLVAPKGAGVAVLAKAVGEAYPQPPSREQVVETVAGLKAAGLLEPGRGNRLSAAGRDQAHAYLDVAELPDRTNWAAVKARHLLPKALGVPAADVATAGKLASVLLRRRFELPAGAGDTPTGVLEALACKLLGFPSLLTLKAVAAAVISRECDVDPPLAAENLTTAGPAVLLGARRKGLDGLRSVALAGLTTAVSPPAEPEPFDLPTFAETVTAVARHCPTGRFGGDKVFIGHVWRQAQAEPQFPRLTLPEFKGRLVEANRERLLTLSRADLVQYMDPADVRESETEYLGATFHFVLTERE